LGADAIIDSSSGDLKQQVLDRTDGRGADAAVVTVGASSVITQAAECLADGGRLNIFAGVYPSAPLGVEPNLIHYKELIVTGSSDSTPEDMHTALGYIESGAVKVEPLVSHVVPLERIGEGFELVSNRLGMKVMVEVGGEVK
jgi:L-iditol 2-dehydrogenase